MLKVVFLLDKANHLRIANNNEYPLWFEIDGREYVIKVSRRYHDRKK